jgi:tellurite resistance protein
MSDHRTLCSERMMARSPSPTLLRVRLPTTASQEPSVSNKRNFVLVTRHRAASMESIATAAALMARADGSADETERRALLRFLRGHDLLRHFGRRTWMSAYADALHRETTADAELDFLAAQSGQAAAPLIAAAAASVALADGHAHPAELSLLRALAERLHLIGLSGQLLAQGRQHEPAGGHRIAPDRGGFPAAARAFWPLAGFHGAWKTV